MWTMKEGERQKDGEWDAEQRAESRQRTDKIRREEEKADKCEGKEG